MWYGWKTVMTSKGAENHNENLFAADLTYPDAVNGKHIELFAPTMLIMMVMKK